MAPHADQSFSHTADYRYIEVALKARWAPFLQLVEELDSFVPKSIADFAAYRAAEVARLAILNPGSPGESLEKLVDDQLRFAADPGFQIVDRFSERVMAEYVTVAILSHALAEAVINAILAIGLSATGAEDVFALIERADIKEKWCSGPKAFHPAYSLPRGGALFETLRHLTRQRNAFVHYKIALDMNGERKLEGTRMDRAPLREQIAWIRRFFSLPYDLAAHAQRQVPSAPAFVLHGSDPIQRFAAHAAP